MESEGSKGSGGEIRWQEGADALPDGKPEALIIRQLDDIRRVHAVNPKQLFRRAVVDVDYLVLLSKAGVIKARGRLLTNCMTNAATGELVCVHNGAPGPDCREAACKYAGLMRTRLIKGLARAYALERRRLVGL